MKITEVNDLIATFGIILILLVCLFSIFSYNEGYVKGQKDSISGNLHWQQVMGLDGKPQFIYISSPLHVVVTPTTQPQ